MAIEENGVTTALNALGYGEPDGDPAVMALVCRELRKIAGGLMRGERPDPIMQPTMLVNEAYLRLFTASAQRWKNREHFFVTASRAMRRVLIDQARSRQAAKRGGGGVCLVLDEKLSFSTADPEGLIALDDAIRVLGKIWPRVRRVVELRCFAGLSVEETADILGVSPKTVKRDSAVGKAWLKKELLEDAGAESRT